MRSLVSAHGDTKVECDHGTGPFRNHEAAQCSVTKESRCLVYAQG